MSSPLHGMQTIADGIHTPIAFTFPNAAARNAMSGSTPLDLNKFAIQSDEGSVWMLVTNAPAWQLVSIGTGSFPSYADKNAQYLLLASTASLANERTFTAGTGLSGVDSGAGSAFTLSINNNIVATISGSTFTGPVITQGTLKALGGISGSHTVLSDGTTQMDRLSCREAFPLSPTPLEHQQILLM
jgi:hypothetical protein